MLMPQTWTITRSLYHQLIISPSPPTNIIKQPHTQLAWVLFYTVAWEDPHSNSGFVIILNLACTLPPCLCDVQYFFSCSPVFSFLIVYYVRFHNLTDLGVCVCVNTSGFIFISMLVYVCSGSCWVWDLLLLFMINMILSQVFNNCMAKSHPDLHIINSQQQQSSSLHPCIIFQKDFQLSLPST